MSDHVQAELDSIFDSKYDDAFKSLITLLEGILGPVVVRIGILSGKYLVSRAENISDPAVPKEILIDEYPCGIAIKNRVSFECRNAQENPELVKLSKVVESGVKYYASRFITVRGGQIIGMICTYSRVEKTLTEHERTQLAAVAKTTGHLVEGVLESVRPEEGVKKRDSSFASVDFTSLFELSPVPTAVMTYPGFDYVAANGPMSRELGIFFDQSSLDTEGDNRHWISDFHRILKEKGIVENFEMVVDSGEGEDRYFLMDGRFWQSGRETYVLVTAREVTAERVRERKLQLLLEVTNIEVGNNWFRTAARAIAELGCVEHVAISECSEDRGILSHAVWNLGEFSENFACEEFGEIPVPLIQGRSVTLTRDEIPDCCPFVRPEMGWLHAIPVMGSSDELIGLITLGSAHRILLSEDVDIAFRIFVARAAAEIARLNFDRSREEELIRITMLQRISQAISRCTDPDQVLNIAAEEIALAFGVSRCVIHRKTEEGGFPVVAEYVEKPFRTMLGLQVPREGNKHAEEVMASDKVVAIADVFDDERFVGLTEVLEEFDIKSMMSARTSFENDANGAIGLQQCGGKIRHWTPEEENLLGAVVANIGVAIAQASLTERERHQRSVIEDALRNAEAASKAKGDFLARMSHELRTPMNSILGFSQLLSGDQNLNDEQRETLKIINRSGEHLMILINDVLEMSKIESGKQDINLSAFSPRRMVQSLSEMFAVRADSKGLKLRTIVPDTLPDCIEADESKLRQIITNLVGNAIKFTAEGEVQLKCWYFRKDDRDEQSGILAFSVSDTGCGMTDEEKDSLFLPFTQARAGIEASEGTGLGLAICKSFVELLGGEIKVESSVGKGSEFTFSISCRELTPDEGSMMSMHALPDMDSIAIDSEPANYVGEMAQQESSKKITVLIADDQPENRLLAVKLLSSAGYSLVEAVDGQDAIDACRTYKPDAILMDVRMPGTDGLAATRTIRKMVELEKQPFIVALTGNAFEEDRKLARRAGCNSFLAKPFRIGDLLELLSVEIGKPPPKSNVSVEKN